MRVPFPEIKDWHTLRIRQERGGCLGDCPDYSVEINGDGSVTYQGQDNVSVHGLRRWQVPQADVRALYKSFLKADFFWLFDEYRWNVADMPEFHVSIAFDGHAKTVVDYMGYRIGMPRAVSGLEEQIDRIANSQRWCCKKPSSISPN